METVEKVNLTKKEANLLRESIQYYSNFILDLLKKERAEWKESKNTIETAKTCLDVKDKLNRSSIVHRKDFEENKFMTPEEEVADFYRRF